MSRSLDFRKIVLCVGLEMAALMGAPLRPDELADLFRSKQQAAIEFCVRRDGEDPDSSYGSGNQRARARCIEENGGLPS